MFRLIRNALGIAGLAAALSGSGLAQEIMPVEDIKPGMKGYGLTVFEGTESEKFDIEVVGVLKNYSPHMDLIVVRSSHPTLSHTGICGGMSGSPIFIDGKLIGAASRFFKLFPKDLLTGVTPIQRMIDDGNRPSVPTTNAGQGGGGNGQIPKKAEGSSFEPIPLPFTVSGVGPQAEEFLRQEMAPLGIEIVRGGSGSAASLSEDVPTDLKPGDAFGVQLMRGDIEFSSGGTVTHRDGNKILGFGHPFFSAGDIEMPMTTARVFAVMSSLQRSDKMQIPLKEVGAITIDRLSCVAGEMGKKADMMPFTINTKNTLTGAKETFQCEVIRHPMLITTLFRVALVQAVDSAESTMNATTVETKLRIHVEGRDQPIELEETVAIGTGATSYSMGAPVVMLSFNPFSAVRLEKIEADVEVTHEKRTATIEKVWLDAKEVKPGEEVKINVVIKPYNRDAERMAINMMIPENLPDDTYDLEIASGMSVAPDVAQPKNVDDYIQFLESIYNTSDLVTILELGTIGTRQEGKALRQLPFSVFGTMLSSTSAGITVVPDTLRMVTKTDYVLKGRKSLKIKVNSKGGQ